MNKRLTAAGLSMAVLCAAQAQPAKNDEAAAIAAAMKRAELLASGPLRVIVEAGKVRRRDAAPVAGESTVALRPAAASRLQSLQLMSVVASTALAPLQREHEPVDLSVAQVGLPLPEASRLRADTARPRLVSSVEPAIPQLVRLQAAATTSVQADLALRADGSVGEVTLLPPVPRNWQRYLREALLQWRFEPLAAATVHRVQLVFQEP